MFVDSFTIAQEFYYDSGNSSNMNYNFEYLSTIEGLLDYASILLNRIFSAQKINLLKFK
jgi:hypothetical protein